ncbi:HD-GYP domain-containing protein [Shewanella sp. YIC-542]|uniref:HD-GYP domain-containing protein n=1 Tax=Shewanella mytili TaxID=3377111 RepID=UPI00398F6C4F
MAAACEKNALIKLPVTSLKVGMYVSAIDHSERLTITSAGLVKHQNLVTQLQTKGIHFVWVDPTRSSFAMDKTPVLPAANGLSMSSGQHRELAHKQSRDLLFEARGLVRKVLSDTFEGKPIVIAEVEALAENIIDAVMKMPNTLKCVSALRSKDAYLLEHSVNVAVLLVTFSRYLGHDRDMLQQLAVGGILHDIGKIKVDDKLLNKPGKLTPEEFEQVKLHQTYAIDIMNEAQGLSQISKDVCLMHHEKLDGNGYPRGLKGDQLPVHGRMSCIVDIYDALTATRCYKEAMSPSAAFKILLSLTPKHLDEHLVYEFIRCIGVYPAGSLVELSDGRMGIVWETEGRKALSPVVKCFYSAKYKRYTDVTLVDLNRSNLSIVRGISPAAMPVDPSPFF